MMNEIRKAKSENRRRKCGVIESALLDEFVVHEPKEVKRIGVFEFIRQGDVGKVLVTDRPGKTIYRASADGGGTTVSSGWVRAPMIHGMTDFDAGWKTVADKASDFCFKNRNE